MFLSVVYFVEAGKDICQYLYLVDEWFQNIQLFSNTWQTQNVNSLLCLTGERECHNYWYWSKFYNFIWWLLINTDGLASRWGHPQFEITTCPFQTVVSLASRNASWLHSWEVACRWVGSHSDWRWRKLKLINLGNTPKDWQLWRKLISKTWLTASPPS